MLGLVRRDLLFDMAEAVAREDGAAAFPLAGIAVEAGYDLRLVLRELARLTRDLLVVSIDRSRLADPEIAAEGGARAARRARGAVLARGSDARLRRADEGGGRHPQLDAAALSPRDDAAALDSPAQAGAAERSDRAARTREAPSRQAGRARRAGASGAAAVRPPHRRAPPACSASRRARRDGARRPGPPRGARADTPVETSGGASATSTPVAVARSSRTRSSTRSAGRRSSSTAPSSRRRSASTSRATASSSRSRRSTARCARRSNRRGRCSRRSPRSWPAAG